MRKLFALALSLSCGLHLPSIPSQHREREPHLYRAMEWEAGAIHAARELGCTRQVWQLRGEPFEQAAAVYSRGYVEGDCLILLPHRGGSEYFLGYAGQVDGCLCARDPKDWTGTPVYYLTDTWEPLFVHEKRDPLT